MKKHIVIAATSLILASSLDASEGGREELCFRPAFQRKLKRVKSVALHSFKSMSLKQKTNKKRIFIDWQKLYWGKLRDLISGAEGLYDNGVQEIAGREDQNSSFQDAEDNHAFTRELRQELKAFAKQYDLKIVWRKKSLDLPDGTVAFLEYWDKGLSQVEKDNVISFSELCALSDQDIKAKGTNAKDSCVQALSIKKRS